MKYISWLWKWIPWFKEKKKAVEEKWEPVKPKSVDSCGCDLSRPIVVPLVPYLGSTDEDVDTCLRTRWEQGIADNCGGLPGDVRPLLLRPNGKTFGWKDVIISGAIRIQLNGERMTLWCGSYKGQRYHLVGASDHEAGINSPDWTPMKSGIESTKKHFVYFECRNQT